VLADRFAQLQQALLARIEQSDNTMAAYIGQLEDRLGRGGGAVNLSLSRDSQHTPLA
jgi:hypothetical protein